MRRRSGRASFGAQPRPVVKPDACRNISMDWDKLRVFQVAADAGSFPHAGETLGWSQSAVSRQVGALEAERWLAAQEPRRAAAE